MLAFEKKRYVLRSVKEINLKKGDLEDLLYQNTPDGGYVLGYSQTKRRHVCACVFQLPRGRAETHGRPVAGFIHRDNIIIE